MVTRNGNHAKSTARDLCRPLFRHRRKMAVCFAATFVLVMLGLIFVPRTYVSDARVLVKLGKESVALDPTATVGQTVTMNESRESEINSELEVLKSQALMQAVVEKLGADYILHGDKGEGGGGLLAMLAAPYYALTSWADQYRGITDEEIATAKLKKAIVPSVARKSNVISVQCKAKNPEQAQRILSAFLDAYVTLHSKANRTSGSYVFFVEQTQLLRGELENATEELRKAKNETSLVSVEGQRANLQSQSDTIQAGMLVNSRELTTAEAKVAALKKSLASVPDRLLAEQTDGLPNVAADSMRNELYKLQIAEKEASSRNTDEHPQVKALRRQVKEMQAILAEQESKRTQSTHKLNPIYQQLETDLLTQESLAAGLRAEAASLDTQYADVSAKIRSLNDNEFRISELVRRTEALESTYRSYVNNREQARIDQALESNRISNVNVYQPATFNAKPYSPRIGLTLAFAFILSTLTSALAAMIAEHFDRTAKSPEQIEDLLGIPVLLSVPSGSRHIFVRN